MDKEKPPVKYELEKDQRSSVQRLIDFLDTTNGRDKVDYSFYIVM